MYENLPLNALRVFEAVSRLKSFQAAADELHVTPSAVSHQMKTLEDWTGRKLVERSARGMIVLPPGKILAESLSASLNDIATASRRVRQSHPTKQLVIAVIPSVATCWLIPKLASFRALQPDIPTRIVYALYGQSIELNEVDLAITYSAEPFRARAGIVARKFLSGESAPVCSAAFRALHGALDTPAAMMRAGLLHDTDMLGWRRWLSLAGARSVQPTDGPVFEDFNLLRAATLAGQGVSLCPISMIQDDLREQRLHQLSDITILAESGYYVVETSQPDHGPTNAKQHFLDWLWQQTTV